jgi:hypothetical protein
MELESRIFMEIDRQLKADLRKHLNDPSYFDEIVSHLEEEDADLLSRYCKSDGRLRDSYRTAILRQSGKYKALFKRFEEFLDDGSYTCKESADMRGQSEQPYGDICEALSAHPLDPECLLADMAIAMRFSDKITGEPRVAEFRKNVLDGRLMRHIRMREEVGLYPVFSFLVNEHIGAPPENSLVAEWDELNSIAKELSKKYGIEYGESRLIVLSGHGVLPHQRLSIIMSAEGANSRAK